MKSFQRVFLFKPRSHPKTFEIARAAHQIGSFVIGYYKELFNRARPSQYEPRLVPLIPIPGHPAYPSGHSTQAHLVAYALAEIMPGKGMQKALTQLAWRVAVNREWAGVHYRAIALQERNWPRTCGHHCSSGWTAVPASKKLWSWRGKNGRCVRECDNAVQRGWTAGLCRPLQPSARSQR